MNIKKYRAATTREALERVKEDLGEDAFVLETRKVNTGGFLGMQKETLIEISAASPDFAPAPAASKNGLSASGPAEDDRLRLEENSPALPAEPTAAEKRKDKLVNALTARAFSAGSLKKNIETAAAVVKEASGQNFGTGAVNPGGEKAKPPIETVEISPESPRIVHRKRSVEIPDRDRQPEGEAGRAADVNEAKIARRELEALRAELHEIKYSLSRLTSNQTARAMEDGVGLEEFGEEFDEPFYESFIELLSTGVRADLTRQAVSDNLPRFEDLSAEGEKLTEKILLQVISDRISFEFSPLQETDPSILALIGTTGVGKTTTVAKLAARAALHKNCRVELVTLDTYRIAAVEQLKTYAEIIGAGCHVVRSVLELDAVLRRLPADSIVLIDTTGKSPHDLADQHELADYLSGRPEIRKCLAVPANTHPADALLAIEKFERYGTDCLILTKMDETMRPGAMIEVVSENKLPVAYLCMGQRVPEDLRIATPQEFASQILRKNIEPDTWQ